MLIQNVWPLCCWLMFCLLLLLVWLKLMAACNISFALLVQHPFSYFYSRATSCGCMSGFSYGLAYAAWIMLWEILWTCSCVYIWYLPREKLYLIFFMQVDEWWEQPAATAVDWVTVDGQTVGAWLNLVKQLQMAFYDKELLWMFHFRTLANSTGLG